MTLTLDGFPRGVDVTRPAYAADPRTLAVAINAHLTRGGDIEQRKAFVSTYACASTKGLAQLKGQLYVFGNTETRPGGLAAQLAYQGLPHPDSHALTDVLSVSTFADQFYVAAKYANGSILHWYDGELVDEWADGRARGSFYVVSGTAGSGNRIAAVRVAGVDVLGAPVSWATSHETTAANVAAQINADAGGYTALAIGQQVQIIAPTAGEGFNGQTIEIDVGGTVAVALVTSLSGGSGAAGILPGGATLTFGEKLYSVSGPRLHFSEVGDPTVVKPNADGAGFADTSTAGEGTDELIGLAPYYSVLALFGRRGVQVWSVDVDDSLNQRLQTVPEVGLIGSRALQPWRDGAVLLLTRRGVKALQSRDSSGRGGITDFSLPFDPRIVAHLDGLTSAQREAAFLIVEPQDGRLWVVAGGAIFVYSYFGSERVQGWTEYDPGRTFTDAVVADHRLYLRDGSNVYLYGGASNTTYDASPVTVRLQFLGGGPAATRMKGVTGFDLGADGAWAVYLLPDYLDPTKTELLANTTGPTFDLPWHPAVGWSSFFSLEFRRAAASRGTISSVHIHAAADASR